MQWMSSVDQSAPVQHSSVPAQEPAVRTYSPMQMQFLHRLQRLTDVRAEIEAHEPRDEFMHRLVSRGLFATYKECIDASVGTEAREILRI